MPLEVWKAHRHANQLRRLSTLRPDRIGEKRLFCSEFLKKTLFSRKYMVDNLRWEF